ncbi:D-alanine--D-alanine ligase [Actinomycetaceae bacterium WB03_NA08]|uniref:D-alanine--D-alanine ligase n=1 Tax=Scrofimicrobium canadense TaxID=2652290 RepID=A0A6N7VPP2_9ACTO|nr:D-alanine--D-alanine ligase family protein [Scrofimicrobium canadense]MSS83714.1 D-alanine--D-alanine ligase [Scrofimicrobium canadense]
MTQSRPTVMVLFGGQSSEHQISCATAAGVLKAINRQKWDVVPVGITPEGEWVLMPDDPNLYQLQSGHGYTVSARARPQVSVRTGHPEIIVGEDTRHIDVVFPLLHGPWGEDGTLQGLLELSAIRYVGCGVAASAVSMNKYLTKAVLSQAGIPVGRWEYVTPRQWMDDPESTLERLRELGTPVFVKPCRAGSSQGISRVEDPFELPAAIEKARSHDPRVIVEAASPGREIECGVLQLADGRVIASPLGEIKVTDGQWYDYETKYFNPDGADLQCPADVPELAAKEIQKTALKAFDALELEGLSRIDFFYEPSTGEYCVNEVNTLPGFTPFSMYPTMLQAGGYSYPDLVHALLDEALMRTPGLR